MPRSCDACQTSAAFVFCRADAAYLCMACDAKIHAANKLASRHERMWMCEVCEQAPAVVTCKADAASLCISCDVDIHSANPLASRHERVPVLPFYEAPKVAHLGYVDSHLVGCGSASADEDEDEDDADERSAAEAESWLVASDGSSRPALVFEAFGSAMSVPSLCADATGISGSHLSDEHLLQARPERDISSEFFSDVDPFASMQFVQAIGAQQILTDSIVPVHDAHVALPAQSHAAEGDMASGGAIGMRSASLSRTMSSSSMEFGVVPDSTLSEVSTAPGSGSLPRAQSFSQLEPKAREARVLRYREKRKNRKFEKTIRYASRKAYAEARPRIKGRFAKRTEVEVERTFSAVPDSGFGVVPSF